MEAALGVIEVRLQKVGIANGRNLVDFLPHGSHQEVELENGRFPRRERGRDDEESQKETAVLRKATGTARTKTHESLRRSTGDRRPVLREKSTASQAPCARSGRPPSEPDGRRAQGGRGVLPENAERDLVQLRHAGAQSLSSAQELIKPRPKRKDIGTSFSRVAQNLFGRHVRWRASEESGLVGSDACARASPKSRTFTSPNSQMKS